MGDNWLTEEYFRMLRTASDDPTVNFKLQCVELYAKAELASNEEERQPLAGEIGFSIGNVYTSLSGWTQERTSEGLGTAQLALMGRWLQRKGCAFWSLGHCYSPEMDYKRQLGHRVYPREDFLILLAKHRGQFDLIQDVSQEHRSSFLADGAEIDAVVLVASSAAGLDSCNSNS